MARKSPTQDGKNRLTSRRTFVGATTAGLLGLSIPGTAAGDRGGKDGSTRGNREKYAGTNGHAMKVSPENAMSDRDIDKAVDRLRDKHGVEAALKTFPERASSRLDDEISSEDVTTTVGDGGIEEGVTRVDSWEHSYDVENSVNQTITETDHFITLFESDQTDADGDTVYFWRGYNYSDAKDDVDGKFATTSMTAEVQFRDSQLEFNQYEPDTKEEFGSSSETLTINLGFAEVGSSFGGSSGYQQPSPSKIDLGYGEEPPAEYEDEWNPNHDGAQFGYEVGDCITGLATGSFVLDTRSPGPWAFWWKTNTSADLASFCSV